MSILLERAGIGMNYKELMDAVSASGLGVLLVSQDNKILDANDAAQKLLHAQSAPTGKSLEEAAAFLAQENAGAVFGNPDFNCYLLPCPPPAGADLPAGTRLLAFRDAAADFRCSLLEHVLNHVSEAITVWDGKCRMLMLNDAAARLEAHVSRDAVGRNVNTLYQARNDSILVIPRIVEDKKPLLNLRQDFVTSTGKELQIISNNYPILDSGEVLGAISLMEDYSKLDEMGKRIIELQRTLENQTRKPNPRKNVSLLTAKYRFNDIAYCSPLMRRAVDRCKQVAQSDSPVMIYGETGTGKELFAQSIHNASPRANGPFLAMNCAAIPDTLLESMLFGTERGAYTGAEKREGLFEQANTGTLLLDEINSMNITLQSKLLRVLQDGIIRRVGGTSEIHVNVRVLSNTNIPPLKAIEDGVLRKDLYYRLGVVNITVPPLRERKTDIMLLAKTFIMENNRKLLKNITAVSPDTLEIFCAYDWPGNVRELQHAIEYAMNIIPNEKNEITPEFIPEQILTAVRGSAEYAPEEALTMEDVMDAAGRRYLNNLLLIHQGNVSQTAKAMGISRQNLQYWIKKLDISADDPGADRPDFPA